MVMTVNVDFWNTLHLLQQKLIQVLFRHVLESHLPVAGIICRSNVSSELFQTGDAWQREVFLERSGLIDEDDCGREFDRAGTDASSGLRELQWP
jgi:hypothetical protein